MDRYISGRPSAKIKTLFGKGGERPPFYPLNHEKCRLFFSARYALAAGIKALRMKEDDEILIPAYNCGVEVDPFLHLKIVPKYYRVEKNLNVDLDDAERKMGARVKGILITHYLGAAQPGIKEIQRICKDKGTYLIEDCAHALLSDFEGRPLGTYGDVAIFSLLKGFPVPNGGVLIINNEKFEISDRLRPPNLFGTLFYMSEILSQKTCPDHEGRWERKILNSTHVVSRALRRTAAGIGKLARTKREFLVKPDSFLFREDLGTWGISELSLKILRKMDVQAIKQRRRDNFSYLQRGLSEIEGIKFLWDELPMGANPLFFPVITRSPEERDKTYRLLKTKGIVSHPWWDRFHPAIPWKEFPEAVFLKSRLLGLPIHQDLSTEHMDFLVKGFREAIKKTA